MMTLAKVCIPFYCVIFLVTAFACSAPVPVLELGGPPTRVVVLDPGISEVFIHLDLIDTMVGRPKYTEHLTELSGIPMIGTGITPNYEAIVRANPQLIFTHATRGKGLTDLNAIAPTQNYTWLSIADVVKETRQIGQIMGVSDAANTLADQIERELTSTITDQSPRVLMLLGAPSVASTELWYGKKDSLHGTALEAAGGINAVTGEYGGPPSLSIEALLKMDPDVIIVLAADATPDIIASHEQFWANLPMLSAVKSGKIGFLTGRGHFSTGARVVQFKTALSVELARLMSDQNE